MAPTVQKDPFYNVQFGHYFPISRIYGSICKMFVAIFKPFVPFLLRDMMPQELPAEERFVLPSLSSSSSSDDYADRHVAIVTGSNTGLGFETASSLVGMGYIVVLACRNSKKAEDAAARMNARNNNNNNNNDAQGGTAKGRAIFLQPLDLSSLESVKSFVKTFTSKFNQLNILVNNAGLDLSGDAPTNDGMDLLFQTNFVGPYLLTRMLIPHLLKAKNTFHSKGGGIAGNGTEAGRVVNLASVTHNFASAHREWYNKEVAVTAGVHDEDYWRACATPFASYWAYPESKLAMILFTQTLNEKYGAQGLRAISCDPGSVFSDIWKSYPQSVQEFYKRLFLTTKQGSSTSVAGAVGDLPKGALFLQPYWQPLGKRKVKSNSGSMSWLWFSRPHPITAVLGPYVGFSVTDCGLPLKSDSHRALWNVCEELVGLKDKSI